MDSSVVEDFKKAAADVLNLKTKPMDSELLEVYGLYKQATIGDNNDGAPCHLSTRGPQWGHLRGMCPKQSEVEEPQVLLDENSAITPELRDALGMDRSTISYRFIPMDKTQESEKWVPERLLTESSWYNRFTRTLSMEFVFHDLSLSAIEEILYKFIGDVATFPDCLYCGYSYILGDQAYLETLQQIMLGTFLIDCVHTSNSLAVFSCSRFSEFEGQVEVECMETLDPRNGYWNEVTNANHEWHSLEGTFIKCCNCETLKLQM
ncbi:hypothetical protein M514_10248 [Trichuris suis]|uniref:ACB domain-containing protein n=1 Tax=Trichuris suis TaxID=68888 RepID=A0A085N9S0_9BILA|nr:hypothetical protein M514_10248 [Trichuris suis]